MIIVADFAEQKQKKTDSISFSKEIKDRKDHMYKKHRAGLFLETVCPATSHCPRACRIFMCSVISHTHFRLYLFVFFFLFSCRCLQIPPYFFPPSSPGPFSTTPLFTFLQSAMSTTLISHLPLSHVL